MASGQGCLAFIEVICYTTVVIIQASDLYNQQFTNCMAIYYTRMTKKTMYEVLSLSSLSAVICTSE